MVSMHLAIQKATVVFVRAALKRYIPSIFPRVRGLKIWSNWQAMMMDILSKVDDEEAVSPDN